jgi:hypothetical protein
MANKLDDKRTLFILVLIEVARENFHGSFQNIVSRGFCVDQGSI